ncbi:MAG TPA: universal stress protein [Bryobacteraceae bacterium]|nr:universal stress protein [Bryobacteraceae bacterium]
MLPIARILLPVDFSGRASHTVRFALPVAEQFHSEILVVHVLQPYHEFGGVELAGAILTDLIAERRQEVERHTRESLSEELSGRSVRRMMLEGDPAHEIVSCAHQEQAGLIMMPTHGYGRFRRLLLGSVTAKVLHDADCPVWTTAHAETPGTVNFAVRRVLCGIDLSPASARALAWAAEFAAAFGAELMLAHAVTAIDPRTESYYFSPEWRELLVTTAEKEIAALQEKAGTHAQVLISTGPAAEMICEEARKTSADLLVIGRGGEAGILGRLTSQAYSIIRQSPCPVVSV